MSGLSGPEFWMLILPVAAVSFAAGALSLAWLQRERKRERQILRVERPRLRVVGQAWRVRYEDDGGDAA